jgi:phytoene synthase
MTIAPRDDDLVRLSASIIQSGSKSFAAAARLFAPETRASAYLLYAWCRHCDDVIDGQDLGHRPPDAGDAPQPPQHDPTTALAELRSKTAAALDGQPMAEPIFQALQMVAKRHAIAREHPFALLDGFAMDVDQRQYATLDDTLTYSYHVAGVVGVMMAQIMGARDEAVLDRASDLGIAFQLTNIARDVMDDARIGRVYLPAAWLDEAGVIPTPHGVLDPARRPAVAGVVARLLAEAERYYASSTVGLSHLGLRSAWAVAAARRVYRRIGVEVVRRGPQAWDARVSTSALRKLMLVGSGARDAVIARMTSVPLPMASRAGLWSRPRA